MARYQKSLVRKQEMLSHLYDLIIEEGFENVSMNKIARKMGVNPSLMVHYFDTKERMVAELVNYLFSTYSRHIIPDLSESATPQERLQDFLDVVFGINWNGVVNNQVFFTYYTLALRRPEISDHIRRALRNIYTTIHRELVKAGIDGVLPKQDWDRATQFVMMVMEGANLFQGIEMFPTTREQRQRFLSKMVYEALMHPAPYPEDPAP